MSETRLNFINWRPDADDFGNDGLTVADNAIHEPEGYKTVYLASAGAFATEAAAYASAISMITKTIGARQLPISAEIKGTATQVAIKIQGIQSPVTTASFSTAGTNREVTAFDTAELNGILVTTTEAQQDESTPTATSVIGWAAYTTIGSIT